MRRALPVLLLALACTPALGAERDLGPASYEQMASEERVALVIGNGAYPSGPLRNPPADARAVADALTGLGFDVTLRTDLDYRAMMTAIVDFGQALRAGGVGVFYYAGHGIQAENSNYLVPIDASITGEAYIKAQAIDIDIVLAGMEEAQNRVNLVILDACRNNPFERGFRSSSGGLAMVDAPRGTLLAYATSPGRVAEDGSGEHSGYTAALLRHLPAQGVKVEEMFKSIRGDVLATTGGRQTPWENTSLVGDFYFRMPSAGQKRPDPATPRPSPADPEPVRRGGESEALLALVPGLSQGIYADDAQIRSLYAEACTAGYALACRPTWHHADGGSLQEAGRTFSAACDQGDLLGCVVAGWAATQTKPGGTPDPAAPDTAQGAALFRKACDGGFLRGCTELGRLYNEGAGVALDDRKAVALYRKACDGGDMRGCGNLGISFADGGGVAEDDRQAVALYRKACDGGEMQGCNNLGRAYRDGDGVVQDERQAVALFQKTCDGGFLGGCTSLGMAYSHGTGITVDDQKAAILFRVACSGGDMWGCNNLGSAYRDGEGVSQDLPQAILMYRKACDGGNSMACSNLGHAYNNGVGVNEDDAQAVTLFRRACDGGHLMGCYNLGVMYRNGDGATQDLAKAEALYRHACDGGIELACEKLRALEAQ